MIYESMLTAFSRGNADAIHGSLLVVGVMLRHSKDFMVPRFDDVCEAVLNVRAQKSRLLRQTVIELLPQLALFAADAFARSYLATTLDYLIKVVSKSPACAVAFLDFSPAARRNRSGGSSRLRIAPRSSSRGISRSGPARLGDAGASLANGGLTSAVDPRGNGRHTEIALRAGGAGVYGQPRGGPPG